MTISIIIRRKPFHHVDSDHVVTFLKRLPNEAKKLFASSKYRFPSLFAGVTFLINFEPRIPKPVV